jgi:hypothetical protein
MIFDRRRLLSALAATTAGAGVAPSIQRAVAAEPLDAPRQSHEENQLDGAWFIVRQHPDHSGQHAVDFWSRPFCDIAHSEYLPAEMTRGALWYEYFGEPDFRQPDRLQLIESILKQDRPAWLENPRQFAAHLDATQSLSSTLLSLVGEKDVNARGRTAFIALDSQSLSPMDPDWADVLPAFRAGYDRIIGHFHLERRGLRQWRKWLNAFPGTKNEERYFQEFFLHAAAQCDAVIVTSPALVETDPGLSAGAPTEALVGELTRRFGYAALHPTVLPQILGGRENGASKPRLLALGSATLPICDVPTLRRVLERQSRLISGSFGAATTSPLLIATNAGPAWSDHLAEVRSTAQWVFELSAPADENTDADGALDLIMLWPFELDDREGQPV